MKDIILKIKILFTRYFFYIDFKGWKEDVWDIYLDEPICCYGHDCCCGGETYRSNFKR